MRFEIETFKVDLLFIYMYKPLEIPCIPKGIEDARLL